MKEDKRSTGSWILEKLFTGVGAVVMTLALFLVLPLMQTIGDPTRRDLTIRPADVAQLPPPPPAAEPPPPEEPEEPPEPPPQLEQEAPPMDLSQLELALNPTMGDGAFGDFEVKLVNQLTEGNSDEMSSIFSLDELDQRPRVIFQRMPNYPPELRRDKRRGTVHVIFIVDKQGRVQQPKVQKSSDPVFEKAALEAVKQWRFEPGTRKGEKVQFKMRIPITFNAG